MQAKDLFDYEKNKAKYSKPSNRRFFNEALEEIIENPKVRYGQRGMPVESESEESSGSRSEEEEEEKKQEEENSTDQKQVMELYTPISKNIVATKRLKQQDKTAENASNFARNKSIHGVFSLLDFTNHSKHDSFRRYFD